MRITSLLRTNNPLHRTPEDAGLSDRANLELARHMAKAGGDANAPATALSRRRPAKRFVIPAAVVATAAAAAIVTGVLIIPGQAPPAATAADIKATVISATNADTAWGKSATIGMTLPADVTPADPTGSQAIMEKDGLFAFVRLWEKQSGGEWVTPGDNLVFEAQEDGSFLLPAISGFVGPLRLTILNKGPATDQEGDGSDSATAEGEATSSPVTNEGEATSWSVAGEGEGGTMSMTMGEGEAEAHNLIVGSGDGSGAGISSYSIIAVDAQTGTGFSMELEGLAFLFTSDDVTTVNTVSVFVSETESDPKVYANTITTADGSFHIAAAIGRDRDQVRDAIEQATVPADD